MSVVKKISAGVAWNTASVVIGKTVMLLNVFLVLHFLTVYEYGFSELVMSVVAMIGIVLLPGLTPSIIADMGVEKGRGNLGQMKYIFKQFFYLSATFGILAWAVLFFASKPVAEVFGNPYAAQFLQVAAFAFLIAPLRSATAVLASVMQRFFDLSFYGVIEELFKCVLLLLFVAYLKLGIHGLIYTMVLSQLLTVVAYSPRTLSAYRYFSHATEHGSIRFWNLVRAHRKWSVGASYMGTIASNSRLWIIKAMLGTEAVGIFAFAFGLYGHISSFMPLTAVITPIVPAYVDKRDQLVRILRASLKLQFIGGVIFLVSSYAGAYVFVSLIFPKYIAAVPLLYVLLLVLLPNSVVTLFNPVFTAFKEQRSMLFSNIIKLLLTIIILPPAIYLFGMVGIGVELVLTTLGNTFERYLRLKKTLPEFSFHIREVLHPDAYEREAMQTVLRGLQARLPRIWPFTRWGI